MSLVRAEAARNSKTATEESRKYTLHTTQKPRNRGAFFMGKTVSRKNNKKH